MPQVISLPPKPQIADDTAQERLSLERNALQNALLAVKSLQDGQNFGVDQHYLGYENDLF